MKRSGWSYRRAVSGKVLSHEQGGPTPTISSIAITWDDQDRPLISVQYKDAAPAAATEAEPMIWLTTFAERLPDKSAKYLRTLLARNEAGERVSLGELASKLGVEKKEVDGWNRNLGRSIKAVVRDHGFLRPEQEDGTAQLFDLEWDQASTLWRYEVPARFRAALIKALDAR